MKITYWSDYMCPFCYIGEANLLKALRKTGLIDKVDLEMKAYELNPNAAPYSDKNTVQRMIEKYGMSAEKAQARVDYINRAGAAAGLDMQFQKTCGANTFDALRLTKFAQTQEPELADRLSMLLFKAVFTDGVCISDHKALIEIAEKAGLTDSAAVKRVLDSTQFASEVRDDERQAYDLDIRSVPYYRIGDRVVTGAYPVDEFVQILNETYASENEPEHITAGATCGSHGCQL